MDWTDFVVDGSDGYGFHGSNCHPYFNIRGEGSVFQVSLRGGECNLLKNIFKKSMYMVL